jgi:hypothetical protein
VRSLVVLFFAVMAVEKPPDARATYLEVFQPDSLPSITPLPHEATTADTLNSPRNGEGHLLTSRVTLSPTAITADSDRQKGSSMTARTFSRSVLAILGLCFAFAASSYAEERLYHGSLCNPSFQESLFQAAYNEFGVTNLSFTSQLSVSCGGAVVFTSSDIREVDVFVYDRNMAQDVDCSLATVGADGRLTSPIQRRSSEGARDASFSLVFRPEGTTPLSTIHLNCVIPTIGVLGLSHITAYRVISTP